MERDDLTGLGERLLDAVDGIEGGALKSMHAFEVDGKRYVLGVVPGVLEKIDFEVVPYGPG